MAADGRGNVKPVRYLIPAQTGDRLDPVRAQAAPLPAPDPGAEADRRLAAMGYGKAIVIGTVQVFALLPGISRDGIVTVTGMFRGLTREDAVRFSFLLSAPVILAAGMLKIPDLFGPLGAGIHGQVLAGSLLSGAGAYVSVRFLVRYFSKARSLTPFAIYCLAAGLGSLLWLAVR
jgi:undecaprenyl-diphosphatase